MRPNDIAKLITEDPDIPAPLMEMADHSWDREQDLELDEYQDPKLLGDGMYLVHCMIGANYIPGEPMVRYYSDGSGYPGSPDGVEWDVIDIVRVLDENGDEINLTPEIKGRFAESVRNNLSDDQVMESMFSDGGPSPDDYYDEDDRDYGDDY